MGPDAKRLATLAAAALVLLIFRAIAAAFESSLVATGQPRARALAAQHESSWRARALAALFDDLEGTAFAGRALVTFSTILAGFLAGYVGASLVPDARWVGGLATALAASLVSLPLASAAPFRGLRAVFLPLGRLVQVVTGRRARFALPLPPLDEMERALSELAQRSGPGAEATSELIRNVFEFRDKVARDVMVPRTDVV